MKVSPIAAPTGAVNLDEGHSASKDRMARAVAVAGGQEPEAPKSADPQVERAQTSIKKIKMRTQRSTTLPIERKPIETQEASKEEPKSNVLDTIEQTPKEAEVTQPLSPQYADLAKAKRALQVREREIAAREAALAKPTDQTGVYTKDQIKSNALGILRDAGVTNDMLTEAILKETSGPDYSKFEAELQAQKQAVEELKKSLNENESNVEKQVIHQIRQDVEALVSEGEEYEAVRAENHVPQVVDLIVRMYKQKGQMLDADVAAKLVNDQLVADGLERANREYVRRRLQPTEAAAKPSAPNAKVMRTLTNRDGSSSISLSRRERAIAAAEGRLK